MTRINLNVTQCNNKSKHLLDAIVQGTKLCFNALTNLIPRSSLSIIGIIIIINTSLQIGKWGLDKSVNCPYMLCIF